jgi:hypothetical protein
MTWVDFILYSRKDYSTFDLRFRFYTSTTLQWIRTGSSPSPTPLPTPGTVGNNHPLRLSASKGIRILRQITVDCHRLITGTAHQCLQWVIGNIISHLVTVRILSRHGD